MPSDDLAVHAKSSTDYYELLGIVTDSSPTEIQRAYRKAALKYHPDKASKDDDPQAVADKFHLLKIASEVLLDASAKATYDQARAAKVLKRQNDEALSGFKRKMKEDLEQREEDAKQRSGKRPFYGTEHTSNAQQQRLQELAREGEQRRKEQTEAKRKAMYEDEVHHREKSDLKTHRDPVSVSSQPQIPTEDDNDTIQVRWSQKGVDTVFDETRFSRLFETYGKVERVFVRRKKGREGQKSSGKAIIVFASADNARRAVEDNDNRPTGILSVQIASKGDDKVPDLDAEIPESLESKLKPASSQPNPSHFSGHGIQNDSSTPGASKGKSSEMDVLARLRLAAKKKAAEQTLPAQGVADVTT